MASKPPAAPALDADLQALADRVAATAANFAITSPLLSGPGFWSATLTVVGSEVRAIEWDNVCVPAIRELGYPPEGRGDGPNL